MTSWSSVAGVRSAMFAPIGLMPIDDITGRAPLGALHVYLDAEQSAGVWRATDLRALVTRSGVITFPGLGRRRDRDGRRRGDTARRLFLDHHRRGHLGGRDVDAVPSTRLRGVHRAVRASPR